jgi:hypothetical protein
MSKPRESVRRELWCLGSQYNITEFVHLIQDKHKNRQSLQFVPQTIYCLMTKIAHISRPRRKLRDRSSKLWLAVVASEGI